MSASPGRLSRWATEVYGYSVALPLWLLLGLLRATVRVEHVGRPAVAPAIVCAWHHHLPATLMVLFPTAAPTIWMNHPAWFMRPVHLFLRWSGVGTLALGSSGHGGRAALEQVIEGVRGGAATFLNPDGPRGPARVVKDGVLDLASRTGQSVTALAFSYRWSVTAPTWDHKVFPLPGGTLRVRWSEPIPVSAHDLEEARQRIGRALDAGP